MGGADAPNATSLFALGFATVVAAVTGYFDRRKARREVISPQGGEAQVVAATFVDHRHMETLTSAVTGLHGAVDVLTGHVARINERMHEDEIVRAAVAKMKEGRS